MDPLTASAALDALAGYARARLAQADAYHDTADRLEPNARNLDIRRKLTAAANDARSAAGEALARAAALVDVLGRALEEAAHPLVTAELDEARPAFLNTGAER